MKRSEAIAYRAKIEVAATRLPDEEAAGSADLFPVWEPGAAYAVGDRRRDAEKLYKCLQAHTSQDGWEPHVTPALWVEVAKPGEYREIKDGMLPTEAFALGQIGWYRTRDSLWKSLMDNNTYTPVTAPALWESVTTSGNLSGEMG